MPIFAWDKVNKNENFFFFGFGCYKRLKRFKKRHSRKVWKCLGDESQVNKAFKIYIGILSEIVDIIDILKPGLFMDESLEHKLRTMARFYDVAAVVEHVLRIAMSSK